MNQLLDFVSIRMFCISVTIFCTFLLPTSSHATVRVSPSLTQSSSTENDYDIGIKAYMYAYPMVLLETTRMQSVMTDNILYNMRNFADPSETDVVRPNIDTLYTIAYLNLSNGPLFLEVPNMGTLPGQEVKDRFFMIQLMDWWSDTFADIGTRTSGNSAQTYMIVGPDWAGANPNMQVNMIKSPTNRVWLVGRIYSDGTSDDIATVNMLQDNIKLFDADIVSCSAKKNLKTAEQASTPPEIVANMSADIFFTTFAGLMKENKPHEADWPMVALLRKIGINPGASFYFKRLSPETQKSLINAASDAQYIIKNLKVPSNIVNGWAMNNLFMGSYGAAYPFRAFIAMTGLGANLPDDAIYPTFVATPPPDGSKHNYTIHFLNKDQLPPVNAFWSITMYDEHGYLITNSINRYSISSRDTLNYNSDGSLDLYIQYGSPGTDLETNWLPAPNGPFSITLRMYWPTVDVLYGPADPNTPPWQMPAMVPR